MTQLAATTAQEDFAERRPKRRQDLQQARSVYGRREQLRNAEAPARR